MRLRDLIPLLCLALAGTLNAAPGWDPWGVHQQSSELLDREDFPGLESLAAQLKKNGYDIEQEQPELGAFYGGTKLGYDAPENAWPDRLKVIEDWRAAFPNSLTAKIAEIYWYLDYPAEFYEPQPEASILPEPGNTPPQINCVDKAVELLKAVPAGSVDDPEYYLCWLRICLARQMPAAEMWGYFNQGVAVAREYVPLYSAACDYLMPTIGGKQGEEEGDIKQWADEWPGPKGDALYAYLLMDIASQYTLNFLKKMPNVDYPRARQGLLERIAGNDPVRLRDETILAFLAGSKGDNVTAKQAFLEIEGSVDMGIFRTFQKYMRWRKVSGAEAEYDSAVALERAGKLPEAEAKLLSFTNDPGIYLPLEYFYERQGMQDKLLAMKVVYSGMTVKQMMALDPGYAPADALGEMASVYAMMGEWDKAQIAAERFVQLRPQNLIGKNIMLLCAIHSGDPVKTMDAVMDIVRMQITAEHAAYEQAQAVLSGASTWEQVGPQMKNNDIYLGQATTAIALFYMARGQDDEAKNIIDQQLPWCAENSGKAVLESLLYGSLSRSLKPVALLPSGPAAPAPSAPAAATGTGAATTGS
jgi:tetratricopeptide (TPR) repeat protein